MIMATSSIHAAAGDPFLFGGTTETSNHIVVNNRILATVNDKRISVIDIMKKMDVLFYKQYPQYSSNPVARFQFYQASWKRVLQDLIHKELIIADAEENKLPVTNGDIRQELEMTFGPNIILNLDKAGLTFDEAWKIMHDDIMLRRMMFFRANAKAIRTVTPQDVRKTYDEYIITNKKPEQWQYMVISIRDPDAVNGAEAANFVHRFLTEQKGDVNEISKQIQSTEPFGKTAKVTISELYTHEEKDISPAYKEALAALKTNDSYSHPVAQKSRDKNTVFRIFYLKEHSPGGAPPFNEVANVIREELIENAIEKETIAYLKRLRTHYHVHEGDIKELIADGFEPFVLR